MQTYVCYLSVRWQRTIKTNMLAYKNLWLLSLSPAQRTRYASNATQKFATKVDSAQSEVPKRILTAVGHARNTARVYVWQNVWRGCFPYAFFLCLTRCWVILSLRANPQLRQVRKCQSNVKCCIANVTLWLISALEAGGCVSEQLLIRMWRW